MVVEEEKMRRSDVGVIVSAGLLLLSLLQPAAAQVKQGVLDKDTFMDMESVSSPAISPDGSQIVFSRGWIDKLKDQGRSNIWIVDAAGTRLRELTRGSWRDSAPVWSPDGTRIAFQRRKEQNLDIWVMGADGSNPVQLTDHPEPDYLPSWTPDGARITFTSWRLWHKRDALLPSGLAGPVKVSAEVVVGVR